MVETQWFELINGQSRMYKVHLEKELFLVNAIVSMNCFHFEAAAARRVALRNGREKVCGMWENEFFMKICTIYVIVSGSGDD